ncbi:MAG: hypothetical protein KF777_04890 [Planctomycetaceae bacterium]|nr:hypothetical protein [Planctomycetaceae bacterium]
MRHWAIILGMLSAACLVGGLRSATAEAPTQQLLKISSENGWELTGQIQKSVCEQVQYAYTVMVPQTFTQKVEENGVFKDVQVEKMVPETKTATKVVCKMVSTMFCQPVDPRTVKAFETDGRPISVEEVTRRCRGETLVVVTSGEEMIPDYYAAIFKPGTIILAVPTAAVPPMMAPALPQPAFPIPQPAPAAPVPAPQPAPAPQTSAARPLAARFVSQPAPLLVETEVPRTGPSLPDSPAPELVFLGRDGVDALKIRQFSEATYDVEVTVRTNDSSVSPQKKITSPRTVRHSVSTLVPWRLVRLTQPGSGDITPDRAKEKMPAGESAALLSRDGRPIDEFWLQNIKPSVFVLRGITLPPVAPVCAPVPGHAPAPYAPQDAPPAPAPPGVSVPVPAPAPQPAPAKA